MPALAYPDFWEGYRWDLEELLQDLFLHDQNVASQIVGLKVEPFSPPTAEREAWLAEGGAFLYVHRAGGSLNQEPSPGTDQCMAQLAALTKSRHKSNELMSYIASILDAYGSDGGTVYRSPKFTHKSGLSTTFMKVPGEVVGPQLIPEQFRDARQTPAMWSLHIDLPRGLPNYREVLGLDDFQ